ncbi:unnamed protein product [Blepharisma stoltei]|uniref:Arf-GAP domain-containing protein n=1 Tax=Blepharisma stoltei TaxID=1481888 RepID=A0AAU9IJV2_9CILI|nr:unnamed protein product [Blepharisma stoltei]
MISPDMVQEIFQKLREDPNNSKCFECGDSDTRFCSVNHGIFICEKCKVLHQSLLSNLSYAKQVSSNYWTLEELKYIIAGGNSAFEEFLLFYGLKDTKMAYKYCTYAAEFYRKMLKGIAENGAFRGYLPNFEESKVKSINIKAKSADAQLSKYDERRLESVQVALDEKFESKPCASESNVQYLPGMQVIRRRRFSIIGWLKMVYCNVVKFGNQVADKTYKISQTPTMKKIDDQFVIAFNTAEKFASRIYDATQKIYYEYNKKLKLVDSHEISYRKVFADEFHRADTINTDENVRNLKKELWSLIEQLDKAEASDAGIILRPDEVETSQFHEEETYFVEH